MIGFDSMGTRGMATVVETSGLKIFIDPGVSIAPKRYGLDPHPLEIDALNKALDEIHRETIDSDILIISHYHRDHYLYREDEEEYYRGKVLVLKDPVHSINYSQKIRAYMLLNKMGVKDAVRELLIADGKEYIFDDVRIVFSKPLPHGPRNSRLGYVVMSLIDDGENRLLHASDVQGPIDLEALNVLLDMKPNFLVISGPPTYFEGYKMKKEHVVKGLLNLKTIVMKMPRHSTIVVDHHLLRDINYYERIREIIELGRERDVQVLTAAEYMGLEINQLEARRRELWELERNR